MLCIACQKRPARVCLGCLLEKCKPPGDARHTRELRRVLAALLAATACDPRTARLNGYGPEWAEAYELLERIEEEDHGDQK